MATQTLPSAFHQPSEPPPTFNATPESILRNANSLLAADRSVQDQIITAITHETATFENVVLPLVHRENQRLCLRQWTEFYGAVAEDEKIRNACHDSEQLFAAFDSDTAVSDDLFALLLAVQEKGLGSAATPERERILEKIILESRRNGLALSVDDRTRLRRLDEELDHIKTDFYKTLRDPPQSEMWFTEDELEGVPKDKIDEMESGTGVQKGKFRPKIEGIMGMIDLLSHVSTSLTRRRIYTERGKQYQCNVALLHRAIVLRHEKAVLLGYQSYAEFISATLMEKSPAKIESFMRELLDHLLPARDTILSRWKMAKAEHIKASGQLDDGTFHIWDQPYYSRIVSKQDNAVDADQVAEYFPLSETIARMLACFEKLFGLKFIHLDPMAQRSICKRGQSAIWNEDVLMYAVWDDTDPNEDHDRFLGYLYMDLHPRPGKMTGFADLPIQPAFTKEDGSRKHTSTGLVCNFPRPTGDKPCLLQHQSIVLLFHELGHAIHDLVAKTEFARFHGASTPGDFNEAPSQMLENWCWVPSTLKELSGHYSSTDQIPLPSELIERLMKRQQTSNLTRTLSILHLSMFDMAIKSPSLGAEMDCCSIYYDIMHRVDGYDVPEDPTPNYVAESYLFSVDAMYIYLISQVYASDMFKSAFAVDPTSATQGRRYRNGILQNGSSTDEMQMLTRFLGRAPNAEAFYDQFS